MHFLLKDTTRRIVFLQNSLFRGIVGMFFSHNVCEANRCLVMIKRDVCVWKRVDRLTAMCQIAGGGGPWAAAPAARAARPAGSGSWTACAGSAGTPSSPRHSCTTSASSARSLTPTKETPSTTLFQQYQNITVVIKRLTITLPSIRNPTSSFETPPKFDC